MNDKQNIRIVDIAKMADVSVGTVDRILHNRGRVSDEKRIRVENVLKEIDYKPNMVARFLASRKAFLFVVIIPAYQKGEYWELVSAGVEKAKDELKDFNVSIDYIYFNQFDSESFSKAVEQLKEVDYAGAIIAGLHKDEVIQFSLELDERELPYVFIDSNIPNCNNLSYFGTDSCMSGAIAAKLMLTKLSLQDNIIIIRENYKQDIFSTQTENREKGFLNYLTEQKFEGRILYVSLDQQNKETCITQFENLLHEDKKIGAITFNSRIYETVELIDQMNGDKSQICLVGYDSIERNAQALFNGKIEYLISQRSVQQGYESVKSLSNNLIFNILPSDTHYMPIDILIKENITFYRN